MALSSLVNKWEAPEPPFTGALVCVPIEAIPFALGGLWLRAQKYYWLKDDEAKGRKLLAEMGARLLMDCGKDIVNAIDRVYMLIDRNENGTVYSYTVDAETGENIISPPLPVVPPHPAIYAAPGSKWQTEDMRDMLYNTLTGTVTEGYTTPRGTNPILEEILVALNAESSEETIELLQKIVLALGAAL